MKTKVHIILLVIVALFLCGASKVSLLDIETAIIKEDYAETERLAQNFIAQRSVKEELDQALYYLGLSQLRLKSYNKSRETFNLLLNGFPKRQLYDRAYLGIIDSFYLEEEFEAGLDVSERLYRNNPDSEFLSSIYLKLARGNLKLAKWRRARMYLGKIIRKFPDSFEAHLARQLLEEKRYFAVQVGAFLARWRAEKLTDELKQKGEYAYIVETIDHQGLKFYRVRVGQFALLNKARKLKSKLAQLGYPTKIYP